MRFPKLTELDEDQRHIYEGAPKHGAILIIGPPGTGKTVIAMHRAGYLKRLKLKPTVLMYNKVLRHYSASGADIVGGINVETVHAWVAKWWKIATGQKMAPFIAGDKWSTDWSRIRLQILNLAAKNLDKTNFKWGHLLIDEGQDHPESMYVSLNLIMATVNANCTDATNSALTVLADDNQRLTEGKNSTVEQIRQALALHESKNSVFVLRKNHRNTLEIAKLAANFYVGLRSGIPELPTTRRGDLPKVFIANHESSGKNLNSFVERIVAYAKLRNVEIGVLVPDNKVRTSVVNRLRSKLNSTVRVQTYASGDKSTDADKLVFDEDGHITVLNFRSAKGLEFDTVFVVDPGRIITAGMDSHHAKMTLYVMCSRARSNLFIMLVKDQSMKTLLSWLPAPNEQYKLEEC